MTDLSGFAADPDGYLSWIEDDPRIAATTYLRRLKSGRIGGEGLVQLEYAGQSLIGPELWDDVDGIWHGMVEVIDGYLTHGAGQATFSGQPVDIALWNSERSTLFAVNRATIWVDRADFIPGLLAEAARYCAWRVEHTGLGDDGLGGRIAACTARLRR